jgi:hypothetical protein
MSAWPITSAGRVLPLGPVGMSLLKDRLIHRDLAFNSALTASAKNAFLFVIQTDVAMAVVIVAQMDGEIALLAIIAATEAD